LLKIKTFLLASRALEVESLELEEGSFQSIAVKALSTA
jgi:hypothetical protein